MPTHSLWLGRWFDMTTIWLAGLLNHSSINQPSQSFKEDSWHFPRAEFTTQYYCTFITVLAGRRNVTQISLGVLPIWSVYIVCSIGSKRLCFFMRTVKTDWTGHPDAQAHLNLRWAHMSFCWFWMRRLKFKPQNLVSLKLYYHLKQNFITPTICIHLTWKKNYM